MTGRSRLLAALISATIVGTACSGDSTTGTTADPPGSSTTQTGPPPVGTTGGPSSTADAAVTPTLPPESPDSTAAPLPTTMAPPLLGPFEIVTADGLILEAERFGTGDVFVVLAHMRPANMSSWFSLAGLLGEEGYSSITFNFRGYGNSEGAGFAVDVDLVAAVDAAFELGAREVFVIGASMGGTGAMASAAQRDVAGVITLSAPVEFMGVDAEAAAAQVQSGMLLIAAEGDSPYNAHAVALGANAAGSAVVSILPGRNHGTDMFLDNSEALTEAILLFLDNQVAAREP